MNLKDNFSSLGMLQKLTSTLKRLQKLISIGELMRRITCPVCMVLIAKFRLFRIKVHLRTNTGEKVLKVHVYWEPQLNTANCSPNNTSIERNRNRDPDICWCATNFKSSHSDQISWFAYLLCCLAVRYHSQAQKMLAGGYQDNDY